MPILESIVGSKIYGFGVSIAGSFESIATVTGTGSSSILTFSNIPSTYQDLQIRYIARLTNTNTSPGRIDLRFNSDSSAAYTYHDILGDPYSGTVVSGENYISQTESMIRSTGSAGGSMLTNTMGVGVIDIFDYANTSKNTTVRSFTGIDDNGTNSMQRVSIVSNLWVNTATITSIDVRNPSGGNWATGTQFALYGIRGS